MSMTTVRIGVHVMHNSVLDSLVLRYVGNSYSSPRGLLIALFVAEFSDFVHAISIEKSYISELTGSCPLCELTGSWSLCELTGSCPLCELIGSCPLFELIGSCPLCELTGSCRLSSPSDHRRTSQIMKIRGKLNNET